MDDLRDPGALTQGFGMLDIPESAHKTSLPPGGSTDQGRAQTARTSREAAGTGWWARLAGALFLARAIQICPSMKPYMTATGLPGDSSAATSLSHRHPLSRGLDSWARPAAEPKTAGHGLQMLPSAGSNSVSAVQARGCLPLPGSGMRLLQRRRLATSTVLRVCTLCVRQEADTKKRALPFETRRGNWQLPPQLHGRPGGLSETRASGEVSVSLGVLQFSSRFTWFCDSNPGMYAVSLIHLE